jgi:hypothetical protein
MITALQYHTSAMVVPNFEGLSHNDSAYSYSHVLFWDDHRNPAPASRYIQDIVNNIQIQDTSLWENISALECVEHNSIQTERSTLLIVMNETPEQIHSVYDPRLRPYLSSTHSNFVGGFLQRPLHPLYGPQVKDLASPNIWHTRISYCLSRKVPGQSRLQIHLWLLLTATILNVIKISCLLVTPKEQQGTPIVTTGDAIASFLTSPCVRSAGMCLLSEEELVRKLKKKRDDNEVGVTPAYKRFTARQMRYYRSVSFSRWIVHVSSYEHS